MRLYRSKHEHYDSRKKAFLIREMHYRMVNNKPYHRIYESRNIPRQSAERWIKEYEEYLQTGKIRKNSCIKRCIEFMNTQPKYKTLLWGLLKIKVG